MENRTDTELIDKALNGDHIAFAALVDRHYLTVYRYAFKWCGTREDAEDITQEVFIKLADKIHLFDRRAKFTTWLYRITANCAMDLARKNRRRREENAAGVPGFEVWPSSNPGPEGTVIARNILAAVKRLPERLREAVLLVYGEGMSHHEAARAIGCAETTVSWRIFQAKRRLRKVLS
jgi:RNA polymerase sigma-70 factor (ECF subfamily)